MRKIIPITAGGLVAAVLTHGIVSSGLNLTGVERLLLYTYRGFFSHVIFAIWRLLALAHGLASISILNAPVKDLELFGRFFAFFCLFTFPLIGLALSASLSSQRISWCGSVRSPSQRR